MTITTTPWGTPDSVTKIADGIWSVTTPSHGGIFLDADRNAKVPEAWRAATWSGLGKSGWYEEDCDACIPPVALPDAFMVDDVVLARKFFDSWFGKRRGLTRTE